MPAVVVITHLASPYQVELFDAVAALDKLRLHVVYLHRTDPNRDWAFRGLGHEASFLDGPHEGVATIRRLIEEAPLVIINSYSESHAYSLFRTRVATGRPWCFWGERPGFRMPNLPGRLMRKWTLRWIRRSEAPVWGIGEFAVEGYRAEFGNRRSYRNIPYFSNLERFRRSDVERPVGRAERNILFSGALIPRKGVDVLAHAFAAAARSRPWLRLRVLGEGPERRTMERVLAPVASQVEFLGFRDWADLPEYYRQADILCVPSRYDGWGLVVAEGLAAGLPVIATDRMGAAREFVVDGQNGWIVPCGNGEALELALAQVATLAPDALATMSAAAQESVREHTIENGARRFIAAALEAMPHRAT